MKITLLILLIISPLILFSQTDYQNVNNYPKRWSVTGYLAFNSSGPNADVEKAMIDAGFDEYSYGWIFGGTSYPVKKHKFTSLMLGLKYYYKLPLMSLTLYLNSTEFGGVKGKHQSGGDLQIDHSLSFVALTIALNPNDILHLGVGPALYFTNSHVTETGKSKYSSTKLGFLFDFGIRFPRNTDLFVEITAQYRKAGKNKIGPFFVEDEHTVELPKHTVNFDHYSIGIGVGLRLI